MSEWTEKEVDMLKSFYERGKSLAYIIKYFGRGKNAVIGKLHRLGLYKGERKKVVLKPTPKPKPKPVEPEPKIEVDPQFIRREDGVEFFDLKPRHCRWPFGESNYWFCGRTKLEHSSYCEYHHNRAGGR
jgi:GcrA cell cycle regulator